jgi:branched-chain amino acid transport system ATP-binding protein
VSEILTINNLTAGYGNKSVLNDISFSLSANEVLAIVGQNGCGKSTLLKTIARIITDNAGDIFFEGVNLKDKHTWELKHHGISWFVQGGMVFPTLKVKEHFELALRQKSKTEAKRIEEECLNHFPILVNCMDKRGGNLSGGQRQMLSFAMLIAQQTTCWLLDEPTAGLSPAAVKDAVSFLQKVKEDGKVSMILVEHNLKVCSEVADKFLLIKEGLLSSITSANGENISERLNQIIYA